MEGCFSWEEKKVNKVFKELLILKSSNTFIFLDLTWRLMASFLLAYQKVKPARESLQNSWPKPPFEESLYKLQKK